MTKTRNKTKPAPWPRPEHLLPDLATLAALSKPGGGPVAQQRLFPEALDQSKAARWARLLGPARRVVYKGL